MAPDEVALLRAQIDSLRELTNTKWCDHDRRSEERWENLKIAIARQDRISEDLSAKMSDFCAQAGMRKDVCMREAKQMVDEAEQRTRTLVSAALGIPAAIVAILSIVFSLFKAFSIGG